MKKNLVLILLFLVSWAPCVFAGEADVVNVKVNKGGENTYNFSVTILHKDTGWDHYANKWEIVDTAGTVLGTRTLHHPHVNEQPFTRSLARVSIPDDIKHVTLRAYDSVHEYGGKTVSVELP